MKKSQKPAQKPAKKSARNEDLVGRLSEYERVMACLKAGRNVLIEGPVGVGKTHLALSVTQKLGLPVFRVDGDSRYSEQKLSGWFDPPMVLKKGFNQASFFAGPLLEAMRAGGVLFINELNRLPEGVQNILLPAIDERVVMVPRLGEVKAKPGFVVVATQNPKEFVATSHLSEAILDRFELVVLEYQDEVEECSIVENRTGASPALARAAVALARLTRGHPRVKRGASVRAAIAVAEIVQSFLAMGKEPRSAYIEAALLALPTRIEIERDADNDAGDTEQNARSFVENLVRGWAEQTVDIFLKKKT